MPSVTVYGERNVVEESKIRLEKLFRKNKLVYFSFSGGKESLCIARLLEDLIQSGRIDGTRLSVTFIDEEAIYPDVEEIVLHWRKRFMLMGAKFHWICLPVRHYNCFNMLYNDMSFICWDPQQEASWIRKKPKFSIKQHPKFKMGQSYQSFMTSAVNGVQLIGLRAYESYQRRWAMSQQARGKKHDGLVYPIYDWTLNDVWLYLYREQVEIPKAYLYMWKTGTHGLRLRISQFFSIDTASSLVRMMEYYPDLYQKILRREPNAYLAMVYWDSEMFRRSTNTKKESGNKSIADHRVWALKHMHDLKGNDDRLHHYVTMFVTLHGDRLNSKGWEILCGVIKAGDPKNRTIRTLYNYLGEDTRGKRNSKARK